MLFVSFRFDDFLNPQRPLVVQQARIAIHLVSAARSRSTRRRTLPMLLLGSAVMK